MLFSSIPGHTYLKERLIEMANASCVGHALLFWGEEGQGALALALALAQQMACTTKEEGLACGKCSTCNKMQKLIHPDLHFAVPVNSVKPSDRNPITDLYIDTWREALLNNPYLLEYQWYEALAVDNKSGNISVHEANKIVKKLSFKAFEGDRKYMVIWLPERMNIQAANTLLKILEEPPAGTHFFLVSEHPEQLLPTIRSRCQIIRVNPQQISNRPEQQEEVALYARQIIPCCMDKKLLPALEWSDEVADFGRERQRQLVLQLLEIIRNTFLEHVRGKGITRNIPTSFFSEAADALNGALADIDRNVHAKMTFYTVALRLYHAC